MLKWAKAMQSAQSHQIVQIPSLPVSPMCPIAALRELLHFVPASRNSPMFHYPLLFYTSVNFISSRCSHNSYNYLTLCRVLAYGECCSNTLSPLNVFFCPTLGLSHHFNCIPWDESFPPSSPAFTLPLHLFTGYVV